MGLRPVVWNPKKAAYLRQWYRDHPEQAQAQARKRRAVRYAKHSAVIQLAKNAPCADCGRRFPPCAMDFDHRESATKDFVIGNKVMLSLERLHLEIAKCDVVCANCHRIRTHTRMQSRKQA